MSRINTVYLRLAEIYAYDVQLEDFKSRMQKLVEAGKSKEEAVLILASEKGLWVPEVEELIKKGMSREKAISKVAKTMRIEASTEEKVKELKKLEATVKQELSELERERERLARKSARKREIARMLARVAHALLAIVLVLSIVACFLPWLKMDVAIVGEEPIKRDIYGYDYIVPLGAPYTAPIAILNVIGFILSAYSFKRTQRIRRLNVVAGILILAGVAASFWYTSNVAFADVFGKGGSFHAVGDYGMGLEALLGFLMIIISALQKPKAEQGQ